MEITEPKYQIMELFFTLYDGGIVDNSIIIDNHNNTFVNINKKTKR